MEVPKAVLEFFLNPAIPDGMKTPPPPPKNKGGKEKEVEQRKVHCDLHKSIFYVTFVSRHDSLFAFKAREKEGETRHEGQEEVFFTFQTARRKAFPKGEQRLGCKT
jgi:hypothetical protein